MESLPWSGTADTSTSDSSELDAYSCAPTTDESGPEIIYRIASPGTGFLSATVTHEDGIDIDLHLLSELDADACLSRGHWDVGTDLESSDYIYLVADSWVDSSGQALSGAFTLTIGHIIPSTGDCDVESGWLDRVGDGGSPLAMPATGPVVQEAHLVTVEDGYGETASDPWPESITEGVTDHYLLSEATTGLVMHRDQSWAPQEGCEYGQSAYSAKLPVDDEGWYVNMYWSSRPDPGTRMIVQAPDGRAVVAAAGYETGPGNLDHVGGVPEEVHFYLGTGHLDTLTLGFAVDQSLPLGPIECR